MFQLFLFFTVGGWDSAVFAALSFSVAVFLPSEESWRKFKSSKERKALKP
jgi:hypothetical protein